MITSPEGLSSESVTNMAGLGAIAPPEWDHPRLGTFHQPIHRSKDDDLQELFRTVDRLERRLAALERDAIARTGSRATPSDLVASDVTTGVLF